MNMSSDLDFMTRTGAWLATARAVGSVQGSIARLNEESAEQMLTLLGSAHKFLEALTFSVGARLEEIFNAGDKDILRKHGVVNLTQLLGVTHGMVPARASRIAKLASLACEHRADPNATASIAAASVRDWSVTVDNAHALATGLGESPFEDLKHSFAAKAKQLTHRAALDSYRNINAAAKTARLHLLPHLAGEEFEKDIEQRSLRLREDSNGTVTMFVRFTRLDGIKVLEQVAPSWRRRKTKVEFRDENQDNGQEDGRTVQQRAYDTFLARYDRDTNPKQTKQPAARVVITLEQLAKLNRGEPSLGFTESGDNVIPGGSVLATICEGGIIPILADPGGMPLNMGREERLFTDKQRQALALRDGGCRWPGCSIPVSGCESHHINPWSTGGLTNVEDGLMLCQFHHLNSHNRGYYITRTGTDFYLHTGNGAPQKLERPETRNQTWE